VIGLPDSILSNRRFSRTYHSRYGRQSLGMMRHHQINASLLLVQTVREKDLPGFNVDPGRDFFTSLSGDPCRILLFVYGLSSLSGSKIDFSSGFSSSYDLSNSRSSFFNCRPPTQVGIDACLDCRYIKFLKFQRRKLLKKSGGLIFMAPSSALE
jgi:hypothetical protein